MTANAGYHLYNTGDVLTAAQVQFNLQNQSVMYFATASARTTALSGVIVEGMVTYIPANGLEYYNGSAWVTLSTGGDITGVAAGKGLTGGGTTGDVTLSLGTTAKGDLVAGTGTTTAAALTVGSDGSTLVADSSTSTGLRYQSNFAAGKNAIINGAFDYWARGTSFTPTSGAYFADRYLTSFDGTITTQTLSRQTFTPGTAPVAGYEGQYFARWAITTNGTSTYRGFAQRIENVQTFAGQTVTFSFWAKYSSTGTLASVQYTQNFGSGGSSAIDTTVTMNSLSLTTGWARYTGTFTVASIAGKTIGTGSYLAMNIYIPATGSTDIWGWQLEASNTATAFQTASGSLGGELALCQRYYYRNSSAYGSIGVTHQQTTTLAGTVVPFPVQMRTTPTLDANSGTNYFIVKALNTANNISGTWTLDLASATSAEIYCTTPSITAGTAGWAYMNNTSAYIGFTAEL